MLNKIGSINVLRKQVYNLIKLHPACTGGDLVDWCLDFLVKHELDASEVGFILDELTTSGEITRVSEPTYSIRK
jgi:hypothetical protein